MLNGLLTMEAFRQAAGLKIVHIPYKGAAPMAQALISRVSEGEHSDDCDLERSAGAGRGAGHH